MIRNNGSRLEFVSESKGGDPVVLSLGCYACGAELDHDDLCPHCDHGHPREIDLSLGLEPVEGQSIYATLHERQARWCQCEHSEESHDEAGCKVRDSTGGDEWKCSCPQFVEAEGDTLENLGVDVL